MSQSITSRIKSKLFQGNNSNNDEDRSATTQSDDTTDTPPVKVGSLPTIFNSPEMTSAELMPINEDKALADNSEDEAHDPTTHQVTSNDTPIAKEHTTGNTAPSRIQRLKNKVKDMNFIPRKSISPKPEQLPLDETMDNQNIVTNEEARVQNEEKKDILSYNAGVTDPRPLLQAKTRAARNSFNGSPKRNSLEQFPVSGSSLKTQDEIYHTLSDTSTSSTSQVHNSRVGRNSSLNSHNKNESQHINSSPFRMYNIAALRHLRSSDDKIELPVYKPEVVGDTIVQPKPAAAINRRRSKTVDVYDALKRNNTPPRKEPSFSTSSNVSRSNSFKVVDSTGRLANPSSIPNTQTISKASPGRIMSAGAPLARRSTDVSPPQPFTNYNSPSSGGNTNSTFSISRRSNSIVNALSSFVNLRTSSMSSNKQPQMHSYNSGATNIPVKLSDLPPPPEPSEDQTPETYLKKLSGYGKFISVILTEKPSEFKERCLELFLKEYFEFARDPLDVALRKLLIFLELPKEAQQIDRLLLSFAKIYFENQKSYYGDNCPWTKDSQVYFAIFSLLMLHTDYFNPNNKHKMTKQEFVSLVHEDTYSEGDKIPLAILGYYFDNIVGKESPKFDFSTYYSLLTPSTPSSTEFGFSEGVYSSGKNSKTSLGEDEESNVSTTMYDGPSGKSPGLDGQNLENLDSSTSLDANNLLIYSPKAIIEQNKLLNSRRSSYNSTSAISEGEYNHPHMIISETLPPSSLKGRPSSNSISSYFPSGNLSSTVLPSNSSFNSSSQATLPGNPFLSSYSSANTGANLIRDDIDIYAHIFNDDLFEMSMAVQVSKYVPIDFNDYTVAQKQNSDNKYHKYYDIIREFKGAYLKIPKNHVGKLNLPRITIKNETESPPNQLLRSKQKYFYLKIIRMGEIEELSANNHWKPKIILLTTCGILVYEANKSGHHHTLIPNGSIFSDSSELFTTEVNRDETSGESYYTVNFRSGFDILFSEGLFAEKLCDEGTESVENIPDINEHVFTIHGQHGKFLWRSKDQLDMMNWIDAINLIGCFCETEMDYNCVNDTIVCEGTESIGHRYYQLHIQNQKIIEKFNLIDKELVLFKQSIPICYRTRNDMIQELKNITVNVNILIRKYRRNDTYCFIIQSLGLADNIAPADDSEGAIHTSRLSMENDFSFNEDSLCACVTEDDNTSHKGIDESLSRSSSNCI